MAATHIQEVEDDEVEEVEDLTLESVPTATDALKALDTLRIYVQQHGSDFSTQYKYEKFIHDLIFQTKHQAKITDYFVNTIDNNNVE